MCLVYVSKFEILVQNIWLHGDYNFTPVSLSQWVNINPTGIRPGFLDSLYIITFLTRIY